MHSQLWYGLDSFLSCRGCARSRAIIFEEGGVKVGEIPIWRSQPFVDLSRWTGLWSEPFRWRVDEREWCYTARPNKGNSKTGNVLHMTATVSQMSPISPLHNGAFQEFYWLMLTSADCMETFKTGRTHFNSKLVAWCLQLLNSCYWVTSQVAPRQTYSLFNIEHKK